MQGLKVNITLTFTVLLAAGMLLINVIITALWQRSLVNSQVEHSTAILQILAPELKNELSEPSSIIKKLLRETNGLCAAVTRGEQTRYFPSSGCNHTEELHQATHQALNTRQNISISTGTTWGVFSTQKKNLFVAVPTLNDQAISGAVGIAYPLEPIWQTIRQDQKIILVYILVNTIILTVIGFFRLATLIIRPIDRLAQEASSYSGKNNLGFISNTEGSEFRQLSSAINRMVGRIDNDRTRLQETVLSLEQANEQIRATQQEMIRTEKLASVGRLSAGLAHEIGNPLGVVLGYLALMQKKELSAGERTEYVKRSEQELNRINLLVRQLLDFSRPVPACTEPVHIHTLLVDILHMLQTQKKNRDIAFDNSLKAENDMVQCNEEALRQAFMNFYLNSLDAVEEGAKPEGKAIITESINVIGEQENRSLQITITDNGPGISPEHLTNIFDPFFTTKDPGKGTGLGLSVSHTIIENAGGIVQAKSTREGGTSMIIQLPTTGQ